MSNSTATRTGDTITLNLFNGTTVVRRGKTTAAQTHVLIRQWDWSGTDVNVNFSKSAKTMAKWMAESEGGESLVHMELIAIVDGE